MSKYELQQRVTDQINFAFTYHAPKEDQRDRYVAIRDKAKELATMIATETPSSREQLLALAHFEETVMWANAAIARNE
jgi:hypothetical protein